MIQCEQMFDTKNSLKRLFNRLQAPQTKSAQLMIEPIEHNKRKKKTTLASLQLTYTASALQADHEHGHCCSIIRAKSRVLVNPCKFAKGFAV